MVQVQKQEPYWMRDDVKAKKAEYIRNRYKTDPKYRKYLNQYSKKYYQKKRNELLKRQKQYNDEHAEERVKYMQDYYDRKKKELLERQQEYYQKNKGYYRNYMREYRKIRKEVLRQKILDFLTEYGNKFISYRELRKKVKANQTDMITALNKLHKTRKIKYKDDEQIILNKDNIKKGIKLILSKHYR